MVALSKIVFNVCFLLLLGSSAVAQVDGTAVSTGVNEQSVTLFDRILQGGFAMIPLGICSLFLFYLVFYCWRETQLKKFVPAIGLSDVIIKIREGAFNEVCLLLKDKDAVLARTLYKSFSKVEDPQEIASKEKLESIVSDCLESEENNTAQWINYINVIASVAPMIGLLGTVSGMISAFDTLASGGMGRPELLAGNIGEALITTAAGLVIGIPAMVAYFFMRNRLNNAMLITVQEAGYMMDAIPQKSGRSTGFDQYLEHFILNN